MNMEVTLFKRPHGEQETINITKIDDEDAAWFESNNVKVSMEDCEFDSVVYADCGFTVEDDPDEGPDEITVFKKGRTCNDVMSDLRSRCEKAIKTRPRV